MSVILKTCSESCAEISSADSKQQERTNLARAACVQPETPNPSPLPQVEDLHRVLLALGHFWKGGDPGQDKLSLTSPMKGLEAFSNLQVGNFASQK